LQGPVKLRIKLRQPTPNPLNFFVSIHLNHRRQRHLQSGALIGLELYELLEFSGKLEFYFAVALQRLSKRLLTIGCAAWYNTARKKRS
jgi:hypothetical protein